MPVGRDEHDNVTVRTWGEPSRLGFPPLPHYEIGERLGIFDFERAAKISGARFAVLRGDGARLQRALITWMLDVGVREHGYTEVLPPYLVRAECMVGTANLPDKEGMAYQTTDDLYLVPTAEVPVTNLYREEILDAADLPICHVAYTACFRREAGAAGKDTRGYIRLHQFDKVEMVRFTTPETSLEQLELLTGHAESLLQRLGIHYRVLSMCTGDMGFAQSKKYDVEAWAPGMQRWLEVSSCSAFGDFQARRCNIRYRPAPGERPASSTRSMAVAWPSPGCSTRSSRPTSRPTGASTSPTRSDPTWEARPVWSWRDEPAALAGVARAAATAPSTGWWGRRRGPRSRGVARAPAAAAAGELPAGLVGATPASAGAPTPPPPRHERARGGGLRGPAPARCRGSLLALRASSSGGGPAPHATSLTLGSGRVVWSDDFTNPISGWFVGADSAGRALAYRDGAYVISGSGDTARAATAPARPASPPWRSARPSPSRRRVTSTPGPGSAAITRRQVRDPLRRLPLPGRRPPGVPLSGDGGGLLRSADQHPHRLRPRGGTGRTVRPDDARVHHREHRQRHGDHANPGPGQRGRGAHRHRQLPDRWQLGLERGGGVGGELQRGIR